MSTELWIEHADLPGEIFDLEEEELFESEDDNEKTFNAFLNSEFDF